MSLKSIKTAHTGLVNRPGIVGDPTLQANTTMKKQNYPPREPDNSPLKRISRPLNIEPFITGF